MVRNKIPAHSNVRKLHYNEKCTYEKNLIKSTKIIQNDIISDKSLILQDKICWNAIGNSFLEKCTVKIGFLFAVLNITQDSII